MTHDGTYRYCCCDEEKTTDDVGCNCYNLEHCLIKISSLECGCRFAVGLLSECLDLNNICNEDPEKIGILGPYCELICPNDPTKTYYGNLSFYNNNTSSAFKPGGNACSEDCDENSLDLNLRGKLGPGNEFPGCWDCNGTTVDPGVVPQSFPHIYFNCSTSGTCPQYEYGYLKREFKVDGCCSPETPWCEIENNIISEPLESNNEENLLFETNTDELCTCQECYMIIKNALDGVNPPEFNCPSVSCADLIALLPNECSGICPENDPSLTGAYRCATPCACDECAPWSIGNYLFYEDMECGCPEGEWIIPGGTCHKCEDENDYFSPCCIEAKIGFSLDSSLTGTFQSAQCPVWQNPEYDGNGNCCETSTAWYLPSPCECWGQAFTRIEDENGLAWVPAADGCFTGFAPCWIKWCVVPSEGIYTFDENFLSQLRRYTVNPRCAIQGPGGPIDITEVDSNCQCPLGYQLEQAIVDENFNITGWTQLIISEQQRNCNCE